MIAPEASRCAPAPACLRMGTCLARRQVAGEEGTLCERSASLQIPSYRKGTAYGSGGCGGLARFKMGSPRMLDRSFRLSSTSSPSDFSSTCSSSSTGSQNIHGS